MHYIAYFSSFFPKSSMEELSREFKNIKPIASAVNVLVFEADDRDISRIVSGSGMIFLYRLLKLQCHGTIDENAYLDSAAESITALKLPKKKLRIECFNINSRRGYSAKDIEVSTGLRLESSGYTPDLKTPEILAYTIIINMKWYSGYVDYNEVQFIDPYRHYKALSSGISRAEMKLLQTLDTFGIKAVRGLAIDLGAAPGGWSYLLAKRGMKVIAIDRGKLNYERINKLGESVLIVEGAKPSKADINLFDIVHILRGFEHADLGNVSADMLTDDMNISPKETAAAVLKFSKYLRRDGHAIITIKCTTRNIKAHIKRAQDLLSGEFAVYCAKVLPSNRQEAMLLAVKK